MSDSSKLGKIDFLFENDEILILNKPFGLAVQGGKDIFHSLDSELPKMLGYKIFLVHRLDKDTSGLMIVAKSATAAAKWTHLIGTKAVCKEYTALCIGKPQILPKQKTCIRSKIISHGKEQNAELFYTALLSKNVPVNFENSSEEKTLPLCLLEIQLGTGRMHQIRIQLAQNALPIAADDQHGNFKLNKIAKKLGIKKLCLSSTKLKIPLNNSEKTFTIPLPPHIKAAVSILQEV